jgi:hypothetical protein
MLDSVNQGGDLSRTNLIQIVAKRNWTALTRNERRLKSTVVGKLESMREQLLPELETATLVNGLQDASRAIVLKDQLAKAHRPPQTAAIPPITAISFYLNHKGMTM